MRDILKKIIIDMLEDASSRQMDLIYRFVKGLLFGRGK